MMELLCQAAAEFLKSYRKEVPDVGHVIFVTSQSNLANPFAAFDTTALSREKHPPREKNAIIEFTLVVVHGKNAGKCELALVGKASVIDKLIAKMAPPRCKFVFPGKSCVSCNECLRNDRALLMCGCANAWYCSQACRDKAWPLHEWEHLCNSECLICKSGSAARYGCPTCRKKYHTSCLYTWLSCAPKPVCPHCRQPWELPEQPPTDMFILSNTV